MGTVRVVVIEQERGEGFSHVPFHVVGEHAEKDVSSNSLSGVVINGPYFQIYGFEATKSAFNNCQTFVGLDSFVCGDGLFGEASSDDIDAVEGRFTLASSDDIDAVSRSSVFVVSLELEAVIGNGVAKVLAHLAPSEHSPQPYADGIFASQRTLVALRRFANHF